LSIDYDRLINWPIPDARQDYAAKDTILYALGVGAGSRNPAADLGMLYERGLKALPTMAVTLATGPMWVADPKTGIDLTRMLHGEESLLVHKPLPAAGSVVGRSRVAEIYDKGADKGAVMLLERTLHDEASDELLATCRTSVFLRGNGGFGGTATGQAQPHPIPDRPADASIELPTLPQQAAIYRLTGDDNPLHIDPAFAARAGFEAPILHGLCTFGIAARGVIALVADNDPSALRRLDVRFARPVFPGDTLQLDLWRESDGQAAFRIHSRERQQVVIDNGRADFAA
jgi:acyl dehydratase